MFPAEIPTALAFDPQVQLADFCLWPYDPLGVQPNRLKSEALLWAATRLDPLGDHMMAAIAALKAELGPGRTVWGMKLRDGALSFELYFYDYARQQRRVSPERVFRALSPFAVTRMLLPASRPYFMFSFDVTPSGLARRSPIDEISYYVGNPSGDVSSGLCHKLDAHGLHFANLYHFFHTASHREAIAGKLSASVHLDDALEQMQDLLLPDRLGIVTVIANKRSGDGLYYSRVRARQMADFLERYRFPAQLRDFARTCVPRLDHLYFDLGLDYAMVDGRPTVTKCAVYGLA
jgi:hypothetical protein